MTDRPATLPVRPDAPGGPDPLSNVLQTVRLTGAVFFITELAPPCEPARVPRGEALARGLALRSDNVISYHVVTRGTLWGGLYQGRSSPVRLDAGDVLVVARGDAYWLGMDPDKPSQPDEERTVGFMNGIASGLLPFVISSGGAGSPQASVVCGFLACDQIPFNPLIVSLPPFLVIRGVRRTDGAPGDRLDRLIDLTLKEAEDNQPGSAIALLHHAPSKTWTLPSLAREAGASRSVLVERFTKLVGFKRAAGLAPAAWRDRRNTLA